MGAHSEGVPPGMPIQSTIDVMKSIFLRAAGAVSIALMAVSCTTTYDAQGNPVQSVDPGTAAAGMVAAGVLGAAISNNNRNDNYYYYGRGRGHGHHRGGRRW